MRRSPILEIDITKATRINLVRKHFSSFHGSVGDVTIAKDDGLVRICISPACTYPECSKEAEWKVIDKSLLSIDSLRRIYNLHGSEVVRLVAGEGGVRLARRGFPLCG